MIRTRSAIAAVILLVLGTSLSGCSPVAQVADEEPESNAPASASALPVQTVPKVVQPLDSRDVRACLIFDSDQLLSLDLAGSTATNGSTPNASACDWRSNDASFSAGIALSGSRDLDLYYAIRETFPVFEPEEVSGYPAVRVSNADGASCVILVGNSDDQALSARADGLGGPRRDYCSVARDVARAALQSLPPRR